MYGSSELGVVGCGKFFVASQLYYARKRKTKKTKILPVEAFNLPGAIAPVQHSTRRL